MNLIDRIYLAISTDEENTDRQSDQLLTLFNEATTAEKAVIDKALIAICGWSLTTLIKELSLLQKYQVRYEEITTYQMGVDAESQEQALALAKDSYVSDDHKVLDISTDYFEIVE